MKPARIILVRHGESMANLDYGIHETVPDHKVELSPKGQLQALEAGQKIRDILDGNGDIKFYVSPFLRARQTLDGILKSFPGQHDVYEADDLREQEWGNFHSAEETKRVDAERDRFGTYFYRIPHGESGADVCTRIATFMNTLHRDFEKPNFQRTAVIVSHGLTIRLFCKRWFHWTVEHYERLKNPHNGEVFVMERYIHFKSGPEEKHKYRLVTPFRMRDV